MFKREDNSASYKRCKGNSVAKFNNSRCVGLVLEVRMSNLSLNCCQIETG